ncbi:hypothetical protein J6590_010141 [Homalodisca vitripennis]|nr:hypothetical protein J6590_010141 [Homalodisca vitripennis]
MSRVGSRRFSQPQTLGDSPSAVHLDPGLHHTRHPRSLCSYSFTHNRLWCNIRHNIRPDLAASPSPRLSGTVHQRLSSSVYPDPGSHQTRIHDHCAHTHYLLAIVLGVISFTLGLILPLLPAPDSQGQSISVCLAACTQTLDRTKLGIHDHCAHTHYLLAIVLGVISVTKLALLLGIVMTNVVNGKSALISSCCKLVHILSARSKDNGQFKIVWISLARLFVLTCKIAGLSMSITLSKCRLWRHHS